MVKIGKKFFAEDYEIDELVQYTLKKMQSMQPGETTSFLSGNVIHESQFAVHLLPTGNWEIYHCDSGFGYLGINSLSSEEMLSTEFWENFYNIKLGGEGNGKSFSQQEKGNARLEAATISKQQHNTCHIQCQIGLLKAFIIYRSSLSISSAIMDWKRFKTSFGNFLIQQNKIIGDPVLTEICQLGHRRHFFYACKTKDEELLHLTLSLCIGKEFVIPRGHRSLEDIDQGLPFFCRSLLKFDKCQFVKSLFEVKLYITVLETREYQDLVDQLSKWLQD